MKWAKRAVLALSVAYAVFLVIVVLLLRFVGEDWWVTSVTLYLPRVGFGAPLPFIAGGLAALGLRRWLATQAFAALVLIFPLMGFVLPVPRFADSDQPKIRVLSYNANSGNGGIDRLADEINRFSPDVVMLQEMYDNDQLVAKMRDRLPHSANPGQFAVVSNGGTSYSVYVWLSDNSSPTAAGRVIAVNGNRNLGIAVGIRQYWTIDNFEVRRGR